LREGGRRQMVITAVSGNIYTQDGVTREEKSMNKSNNKEVPMSE
jgi:hypothetical protein